MGCNNIRKSTEIPNYLVIQCWLRIIIPIISCFRKVIASYITYYHQQHILLRMLEVGYLILFNERTASSLSVSIGSRNYEKYINPILV